MANPLIDLTDVRYAEFNEAYVETRKDIVAAIDLDSPEPEAQRALDTLDKLDATLDALVAWARKIDRDVTYLLRKVN